MRFLPKDRGSDEQIFRDQAKPGTAWSAFSRRCAAREADLFEIAKKRGLTTRIKPNFKDCKSVQKRLSEVMGKA